MLKKISFLLITLCTLVSATSCSDNTDEPVNPVFAFVSSDNRVSITNEGKNAVINVLALCSEDFKLPISGTFINAEIEENCKWLTAKIDNKTLVLSINSNFSEESRSANISIKANDTSEIIFANVAVNQSGMTQDDYELLRQEDLAFMAEYWGGLKPLPTDGNFEEHVVYQLNKEGTVLMVIADRADNPEPIRKGDMVYPSWRACYIDDVVESQDYWSNSFADNLSNYSNEGFAWDGLTPSLISKYGEGILLPIQAGICYGDDIDLIVTPKMGIPSLSDMKWVYDLVIQYNKTPAPANNTSAKSRKVLFK